MNFGHGAKSTQINSQLFIKDSNEHPDVTDPSGNNEVCSKEANSLQNLKHWIYRDPYFMILQRLRDTY